MGDPTRTSDRQFDLAKVMITILASVLMLAGGGWLAMVHARTNEADRKAEAAGLVAADARAKADAALAQQGPIVTSIAELKRDMNKQMEDISRKIDALYAPIGGKRR